MDFLATPFIDRDPLDLDQINSFAGHFHISRIPGLEPAHSFNKNPGPADIISGKNPTGSGL
jgi:hypothetical protein